MEHTTKQTNTSALWDKPPQIKQELPPIPVLQIKEDLSFPQNGQLPSKVNPDFAVLTQICEDTGK